VETVPSPNRRRFLTTTMTAGLSAWAAQMGLAAPDDITPADHLPRRPYGHTGRLLSVIGLGGIVVSQIEQSEANDIVARAFDRGVNYYDVAPTYSNAQERLGPALEPYRDRVFLACKTAERHAAEAQAELEQSLKLLRTDHLDLYQLHGLTTVEDVETVFAPGGAFEVFLRARDKGQVRYLGFSAHTEEAALLALDQFDFDSVLFPFNAVCYYRGNFGRNVLERARDRGAARLALKALAWTPWAEGAERTHPKCWYQPITDRRLAFLALRFTLGLPLTAAVPPGDPRVFEMAVDLGLRYRPLEREERQTLLASIEGVSPIFSRPEGDTA